MESLSSSAKGLVDGVPLAREVVMVASVIGVVLGPEASVSGESSVELAVGWSLRWGGAWVVALSQGIDGGGAVVDAGSGGCVPPRVEGVDLLL